MNCYNNNCGNLPTVAAQNFTQLSVVSSRQRSYDWLRCEGADNVKIREVKMVSRSNYKNLIIIGNGFDCWQGIPTSYEKFRVYYNEHIEEVASKLGYSFYTIKDTAGIEKKITAVELK